MQYEAMRALTGQPIVLHQTQNMAEGDIWGKISEASGKKFIMTASCLKDFEGLIGGHAYSIMGIKELKNDKGSVVNQLIQLKNPIGQEEYTGPWNNLDDKRWTSELKKQASSTERGSFFMDLKDFKKAF